LLPEKLPKFRVALAAQTLLIKLELPTSRPHRT
jgi:hypothetical protein